MGTRRGVEKHRNQPPSPPPLLPANRAAGNRKHRPSKTRRLSLTFPAIMAGQSRKWMILVATIWIQAFTGTNFDFSAYSSTLKSVLGISQVQLNYLAVASDLGKALGWSSGIAVLYLPLWAVLFISAFIGATGYFCQWLVIQSVISLPYFVVFLLCLLAGCSICWFNTVCFVLCIRNFPVNRSLALALTISFNGVSPALYNLVVNAVYPSDDSFYLLLNAVLPLCVSVLVLLPILRQPPPQPFPQEAARRDSLVFLILNLIAVITGVYLLVLNSSDVTVSTNVYRFLLVVALLLMASPLLIPGIVYARDWARRTIHSSFRIQGSGFNLVDVDDLELHKELLGRESSDVVEILSPEDGEAKRSQCYEWLVRVDKLKVLGDEHTARRLLRRLDFWLYFVAYFCGGTVGLVYSNNLGQIVQSLKSGSEETTAAAALVSLYSSCSFFGRLLSAAPDFSREKMYVARTGWMALALIPTPIAFLILATWSGDTALQLGTALIGLSSGFIFAAAVSITSELFGPNSVGVNHNILIVNIPIGSLLYGSLAALNYDANGSSSREDGAVMCMGRSCYEATFVCWAIISTVALLASVAFFLRTRAVYDRFEKNRIMTQLY